MELIFYFLLIGVILWTVTSIYLRRLSSDGYQGPVSDHFDGERFYSYGPKIRRPVIKSDVLRPSLLKWMLHRPKNTWVLRENLHKPTIVERVLGSDIKITYVNHSTFLIQMYGKNILTDPIFANRASPFSFLGPKRYRAPGIASNDLPPIDIVLLSHNHYDHMDIAALRTISKKWNPRIITGLGNSAYLMKNGINGGTDLDWWDKQEINSDITIVGAPAQHFSARAFSDRNKTLWMGFVLETKRGNIYVAADTGYGAFVEKIKEKYSSFILAFLPIGAYLPPWMMSSVHISPDEALKMHQELNIQESIAMHFGTFKLADDGQDEPPQQLRTLLEQRPADFRILENGEECVV